MVAFRGEDIMRRTSIGAAAAIFLAIGMFGAACQEAAPAQSDDDADAESIGQVRQEIMSCRECGDGWYCDDHGQLVHMVADWWNPWTCHEDDRKICPSGCAVRACKQQDTCL